MTDTDTELDRTEITPHLAAGLETLRRGAQSVMAQALARLPAAHRAQLMAAVDADTCTLTLQLDLPSFAVRVLADGVGWPEPQLLCTIELGQPTESRNSDVQ